MAKLEGVKVIDMVGGEVTKIAYEGEEYAKVEDEGRATEGDLIYTISSMFDTLPNSFYKVVRNGYGDGRFYDEAGDSCKVLSTPCTIFRKTSAKPTLTDRVETLETRVAALEECGKQAEVIEGDPQVGDKIRIVDAWFAEGRYENGDIRTVARVDSDKDVRVEEHRGLICRSEFEIIERNSCVSHERPEKAEEPALKVGDYAKVIGESSHSFNIGEIVEITELDEDDGVRPFAANKIDGTDVLGPWLREDEVVKATDEEVSEAKRKLAEEQEAEAEAKKWAEIGRKPNEFKEGDIITYESRKHGRKIVGEIDSICAESLHFYTPGFGMNAIKRDSKYVELITPVERRFDR